jgi:DNA-binding transcriptional ArsR family regulator
MKHDPKQPRLDPALLPVIADVLKSLGHPLRLRILESIAERPLAVREIQDAIGAPQAIVSQHLRILRAAKVVEASRDGIQKTYRLVHSGLKDLLRCLTACQEHCRPQGR